MNETAQRLLTAFILIPIVLACLYYGGIFWMLLITLVGMQTLREFFGLMTSKGFAPFAREGYIAAAVIMVAAGTLDTELMLFVMTVVILGVFFAQLSRKSVTTAIPNIAVTIAGILYIPWLLSHGVFLRSLSIGEQNLGIFVIFFCLATTFLADTGGYFAGRQFGKHKIIPSVSPKKSWEGLAGSVLFAALGGFGATIACETWFHPTHINWKIAATIGVINAILGLCGDLVESVLKRDADVKDSGTILPGHGGFLDRIDAVLFTIPINYHIFRLLYSL